jgi:membrane protein required for beta-lactamase induction
MTFIIICIALIVERFFHWTDLRHWRRFMQYEQWIARYINHLPSSVSLILCLLPPLLLVGMIEHVVSGWLYGAVKLIFGIVVLLYCLGPNNLWAQVYRCLSELHKDDPATGAKLVETYFGIPIEEESQLFHQLFVKAIFLAAQERIFSVIFWFVLLGPVGAVLYRLIGFSSEQSALGVRDTAVKAKKILDWLPVRIFTLFFALCGHFKNVFIIWKKYLFKGLNENIFLLNECGIAALDVVENGCIPEDGSAEKETLELLDRVFVMALVVVAVVVLIV